MIPYLLIILAFAADRVTKGWAADNLSFTQPIEVNQFLTFQKTYNRGVAFGMFQGIGPVVGWFSIIIVAGLFVYLLRTPVVTGFCGWAWPSSLEERWAI